MDTIIDPVLRDLKPLGDLRNGEMARDAAGMRLTPLHEESMAQTNNLDRADQHDGPLRRAVALSGKVLGDLSIRLPLSGHPHNRLFHLAGRRQAGQGVHCNRDLRGSRVAPLPDDPRLNRVGGNASDDDLVDQAAEQRLLLSLSELTLPPESLEILPNLLEGTPQLGRDCRSWAFAEEGALVEILRLSEFLQGDFPAPLQFAGDEPILGIGPRELSLGQACLIPKPIDLLEPGALDHLGLVTDRRRGLVIQIQLGWREGLEERPDHEIIDRIGREVLADRDLVLLS